LNIGLNFHLLIKIYDGTFNLNPMEYIFGADILFLAGFSIIFIAFAEKLFLKQPLVLFILALLITVFTPYLPDLPQTWKFCQAFFYGNYSWSYFPVFPWLAYPLLGYAVRKYEMDYPEAWKRLNQKLVPLLTLTGALLAILFIPAFRIITELSAYYHHQVFLFTWLAGFLILYTWLVFKLNGVSEENTVLKYIKWLGKNVTIVYVVQWLIIGNIATAIYKTQDNWSLVLWFIAILSVTSLLTYVIVNIQRKKTRI
jgi:hypothetical protein